MGPPLSESKEVGFDQDLIRPSASSTLTRRPPDKVLDGVLLAVACKASGRRVPVRRIPDLFRRGKMVSLELVLPTTPCVSAGLGLQIMAKCSHGFALFASPSTVNEGVGFARTEPRDECSQMLKLQRILWS